MPKKEVIADLEKLRKKLLKLQKDPALDRRRYPKKLRPKVLNISTKLFKIGTDVKEVIALKEK